MIDRVTATNNGLQQLQRIGELLLEIPKAQGFASTIRDNDVPNQPPARARTNSFRLFRRLFLKASHSRARTNKHSYDI